MKKLSKKSIRENAEILIRKLKEEGRYKRVNEKDFDESSKEYFKPRRGHSSKRNKKAGS